MDMEFVEQTLSVSKTVLAIVLAIYAGITIYAYLKGYEEKEINESLKIAAITTALMICLEACEKLAEAGFENMKTPIMESKKN
jgi:hypothetical protein